jgi:hypothetical protein
MRLWVEAPILPKKKKKVNPSTTKRKKLEVILGELYANSKSAFTLLSTTLGNSRIQFYHILCECVCVWYWGLNSGPSPWATELLHQPYFCEGFFEIVSCKLFALAGFQLRSCWSLSVSWVARITGMSHQCQASNMTFSLFLEERKVYYTSGPAPGYLQNDAGRNVTS